MRLTRLTQLVLVAAFVSATPTFAQVDASAGPIAGPHSVTPSPVPFPFDSLRPGLRVRVMTSPTVTVRRNGTVVGLGSDTLVFRGERDKELLRLSRSTLQAMEVSAGPGRSSRRALAGAAIGTVAGFGLARLFQWMDERDGTSCISESGNCPMRKTHLFGGLFLGAGIGFSVGASTTGERWRPVALR